MILKDNHLFSVYNGTEGFELISGLKLILKNHKEQGDGRGGGGEAKKQNRISKMVRDDDNWMSQTKNMKMQ